MTPFYLGLCSWLGLLVLNYLRSTSHLFRKVSECRNRITLRFLSCYRNVRVCNAVVITWNDLKSCLAKISRFRLVFLGVMIARFKLRETKGLFLALCSCLSLKLRSHSTLLPLRTRSHWGLQSRLLLCLTRSSAVWCHTCQLLQHD